MRRMFALYCAIASTAVSLAPYASADDVVRCRNGRLVNVGMVSAEVVARCGEPRSRTVEEIPVRARLPNGAVIQTGTTKAERWIYRRGQGQFDAQLTFEDDKLVRIDLLTER
ncbi:MAG: DUF2845 domain-containing protein [Lysobacterales bacterium]|nr:MAG: DUF2845 domain-containing protein [Xanthomonadales bacterium]